MAAQPLERSALTTLLRDRLSERPPRLEGIAGARQAAVLVPVVFRSGTPHLIFTVRTHDMPTHKGQVSFPGGGVKDQDADLAETALRETEEEIGLGRRQVEVLGQLDPVTTLSNTFMVTPYVGTVDERGGLTPNPREVAAIFETPLSHLLDPDSRVPDLQTGHWRYPWNGHDIWGATARILNQFLLILGRVDPFAEDLRILQGLTDPEDKLRFTELMKTFHPRGRGVADYIRQSPPSVATPAIRALVLADRAGRQEPTV